MHAHEQCAHTHTVAFKDVLSTWRAWPKMPAPTHWASFWVFGSSYLGEHLPRQTPQRPPGWTRACCHSDLSLWSQSPSDPQSHSRWKTRRERRAARAKWGLLGSQGEKKWEKWLDQRVDSTWRPLLPTLWDLSAWAPAAEPFSHTRAAAPGRSAHWLRAWHVKTWGLGSTPSKSELPFPTPELGSQAQEIKGEA